MQVRTFFLLFALSFAFLHGIAQGLKPKDEQAIRTLMQEQQDAWNTGSLTGFMQGYWQDQQLVFVGSKGPTYGWQATLDRYEKSYPDQATMGQLQFELLELRSLGRKHALVVGKWALEREEKDNLSGHFSLVLQKFRKIGWQIVADHSS